MNPSNTYIGKFIIAVGSLIKLALPLVAGLALLFFLWGVVQFVFKADSDKAREEGKERMIWGVIALFVIVSTWGIVGLLGRIFSVSTHTTAGTSAASTPFVDSPTDCGGIDQPLCDY
jgi:hypothetical protein